jgi:hypothetical protein
VLTAPRTPRDACLVLRCPCKALTCACARVRPLAAPRYEFKAVCGGPSLCGWELALYAVLFVIHNDLGEAARRATITAPLGPGDYYLINDTDAHCKICDERVEALDEC